MSYNGWENRETWNVALWINNQEDIYYAAAAHAAKTSNKTGIYKSFIKEHQEILGEANLDGVRWDNPQLDYAALDELIAELAEA